MKKVTIAFLVLPHVQPLDLAGPLQVFLEAKDHGANWDLVYCSIDEHPSQTVGNFPIPPLRDYRTVTLNAGDYLVIPGADVGYLVSKDLSHRKGLFQWTKELHERGVILCSVCTGAFFLAHTGLLDNRRCTTHWKRTAQLQALAPKAKVAEDILFTEDSGIYTSAGVTAGIDLALHLVSKLAGDHASFKVARELVVYKRRSGNEEQKSVYLQYRNHIHTGVHRVQDYVLENMKEGTNLSVLSEVACMSSRNLTRTFKRETGITVNEYVNIARTEKLRELIKNPDLTRKQLAGYCGLKSERQVIRLIKQYLEVA